MRLIPLVYYIYYNNLAGRIVKANYDTEDLNQIRKWINLSFIKSIFAEHTDAVLVRIRRVLRENIGAEFPFTSIRKAFELDVDRNYHLDAEFIDGLLTSSYESNGSFTHSINAVSGFGLL